MRREALAAAAMFAALGHHSRMRVPAYAPTREPVPQNVQAILLITAAEKRARRCAKRGGGRRTFGYWGMVRT